MLRYDIRTGIKKIKTKTAIALSGATLGIGGLLIAMAMPLAAKAADGYSLFGNANAQSDGVHLSSDGISTYSGVSFTSPPTTVSDLNTLSINYQLLNGNCGAGSPRFSVETADGNIFVYIGNTPNFNICSGGSTGNLLSDVDSRVDTSQVGGTFYDTWAHAKDLVGGDSISGLVLVVDSGPQEDLVTSATVNSSSFNFLPATSFQVKPWTYDPGKTRAVSSAWVTHEGLADAGNSNHALYLAKKATTATNAAGGATVTYTGNLSSLGFDVRNDGHCGAGAPRLNVYTSDGITHFFGCVYGTHTTINSQWTRVQFAPSDGFPAVTPSETVTGMDVVFDEGIDQGLGFVYLDNIQVNGVYAGKPGLAQ